MSKAALFGIVAGEKSGDILGAGLIAELRKIYPDARFVGIGGQDMIAQGCESIAPMDRLSVMGFVEPLGRLPELFALKKRLRNLFIENPPLAFIGIDSPDFNLRLESELHQHNIKTVHYVSPSVWAYREKRINKIKGSVDLMLTLFPFETQIYTDHKIAVKCVGHPLADTIGFDDQKDANRDRYNLSADDSIVTLMPGSRGGEIKRLGPIFLAAALESLKKYPQLKFLIPYSSPESKSLISTLLKEACIFPGEQFQLVDDSHSAISAADLVILASGTATLETLLLRRPMIVGYKLANITYAIASRMVKIPYVALPNLLAGRQLVPEYIQHNLTEETLLREITEFMSETKDIEPLLQEFDVIHRELRLDASAQAAAAIAAMLDTETS
ncbi:MAG: lipid-A-disaccharide synthase [SAR86 cluster bacterium]|uniref:Lipid-A-disaccharide synthase n=1 Tax=SAR86 cluster bacterium TaxID=2030880 RepID=A0A2A5AZQ1_9GAMM|nr:MAG: lipid-A-disaccharide synthase [SAR86 cluster bacterium]